MRDKDQPGNLARQAQQDSDIYELKLYVAGNSSKSQLALNNLKEICYKYLEGRCRIEVIDLMKNPGLAREDQIVAIPTLMRKNYPGRKVIGDLSDQKRVLGILGLHSSLIGAVNEKISVEKTSVEESEARIMKGKKSKGDLQPYIGRDLYRRLSQNLDKWAFSLYYSPH